MVYDAAALATVPSSEIGGKAEGLQRLVAWGFQVPPFFVISAAALRRVVDFGECSGLESDSGDPTQIASAIRHRIDEATLSAELVDEIRQAERSCLPVDASVAVRSSAALEDRSDLSYAGIYESMLGVRGLSATLAALKRVWISAVSPRAIAYRQHHGLPPLDARMAVIVQLMAEAHTSGVCFTCDPVTGSRQSLVISALYGLGEGLVSRGFPSDTYRIDRNSREIIASLAEKTEQLAFDSIAGEMGSVGVSGPARRRSSLSDEQVAEVVRASLEIESRCGSAQDVVFCFTPDQQLHILQTRCVTSPGGTSAKDQRSAQRGNHLVWDNSNIIESYAGVTTPMTFSFIRRAYSIVYHCFAEVMGISPQVVQQHHDTFENMLGFFRVASTTTSRSGIGWCGCFRATATTAASWKA